MTSSACCSFTPQFRHRSPFPPVDHYYSLSSSLTLNLNNHHPRAEQPRVSPTQMNLQQQQHSVDDANPSSSTHNSSSKKQGFVQLRTGRRKKDPGFRRVATDLPAVGNPDDLSVGTCNVMLKKLESSDDGFNGGKAIEFFEWMRVNGKLRKNPVAYNLVLRVLTRRKEWGEAESLINEMVSSFDIEVDHQPYNTVIYAASKYGLVDVAARFFRMMLKDGVLPNVASFGMVMQLYQKYWKVEEAEFSFHEMRRSGIKCQSAYSAMITIYTRLNLYDKAEGVIRLLTEDEVVFNLENWLVSLNAYSQQGKMGEARRLLLLMNDEGIPPNIIAYNSLITGYGKVSDMEGAGCVFREMNDVGLVPDETTYRTMIEGWGRAGNYSEAQWFYNELKRLGLRIYAKFIQFVYSVELICQEWR